jgi:prophage antirepressor-like protein
MDLEKMTLTLDGKPCKVVYFSDDQIWFQAKPLVVYLEYSTSVSDALQLVNIKYKKSLKELLESLKRPNMGGGSEPPPLGYNELKASYIHEAGLYSLIFRSTKPQARDFSDWVCEEVLTSIRKHGSFSLARPQGDASAQLQLWQQSLVAQNEAWQTSFQQALVARDEAWQQRMEALNEGWKKTLQRCLETREEALRQSILFVCGSVSTGLFSLHADISQRLASVTENFCNLAFTPSGSFVDALRKAVKRPAIRRNADEEKFPAAQRISPEEEQFVVPLAVVLAEELEASQDQRLGGLPREKLHHGAWKRCRGLLGSRCLALRKLSKDASKPLLWTTSAGSGGLFNGGGRHYVYLRASKAAVGGNVRAYVRKVLRQKYKKSRNSPTVEEHVRALIRSTPLEDWPVASSNLDAFPLDEAEEELAEEELAGEELAEEELAGEELAEELEARQRQANDTPEDE